MVNSSLQEGIRNLRQESKGVRSDFADFEEEELILYFFVIDYLQKANLMQF